MYKKITVAAIFVSIFLMGTPVHAGSLTPPGAPARTMYTLDDFYNKLTDFSTTASGASGSLVAPGTVSSTFHNLSDIYGLLSSQNSNLVSGNIKSGTTIFGVLGTLASLAYGDASAAKVLTTASNAGTYNAANLTTATVKSGTSFGVSLTGDYPSASNPLPGDTAATDATVGSILAGQEAWTKAGALFTGTLPSQSLSAGSNTLLAGYYSATTLSAVDTDLTAGNIRSGTTIFGVLGTLTSLTYGDASATKVLTTASSPGTYNAANLTAGTVLAGTSFGVGLTGTVIQSLGNAVAANVLSTATFSNATGANITGTMPTNTLSAANDTVAAGYYAATNLATIDTDLVVGNIKSGTTIFGVLGTLASLTYGDASATKVLTTASSPGTYNATNLTAGTVLAGTSFGVGLTGTLYPSTTLRTNQTVCYDANGTVIACSGTGQDGALLIGTAHSYTDNGNGTITDNSTGHVWQKQDNATTYPWQNALNYCNANTAGLPGTGWRLPNLNELLSIVDYSTYGPTINNTYFPSTHSNYYWSSTSYSNSPYDAWYVSFLSGSDDFSTAKTGSFYVRCVRG